jgi:hypothetical protein
MIKLLDIIEEGTLTLTPDERQQVEAMIPEMIKVISEPDLIPLGQHRNIGTLKFKFADGEDGEVLIGVGTFEPSNARGAHHAMDLNNKTDNLILIQQAQFKQYFPSSKFNQIDQNLYRTFTGTANTGVERLRQVIKHEIIHAKDPALNHRYSKEPYDSSDESVYFKSWAEFQTFTGQFFESLIAGTDRVLSGVNTAADLKRVESALANILQFFAGKTKTISINTAEFIDGTGSRNIFQKAFNVLNSMIGNKPKSSDFALSEYVAFLYKIKQYNPEGYKEFLKDLYKTIKTIEEKVNSTSPMKIKVQEMKQNINEVKRMQQLAGLLTEAEEEQVGDASSKLASAFKTQDVSSFVDQFKAIASDPKVQAILKAGTTDGKPEDEKVTYAKGNVAVKGLLPTQNEIGFDQSIANILTDQYGSLKSILGGSANVGGPIVTYNGKYVIDGHHRWSQVYAANPNATMENLDIKGDLPPTEILKLVHAAIAAKVGKVPSADPKGINILDGISEKQVLDAVNSKLADSAKTIWAENGQKDNNAIAKYIYNNLKQLISKNKPVAGAPGRKDMPQTDVDGDATGKLGLLQKGMINFKDPKSSDIKNDQSVKEMKRLQQLAGILNEEEANAEQAAEKGLASFEDQLQAFAKTVKPSPKDKKLNEIEPASTLFALVVGAPGLLDFLGKGADAIGNFFSGGAVKKNMIGQALQKAGHKLEHAYIDGIASILTGFFPELYANQNQHDEASALHDHCHAIYAALVGAAAIVSGIGATHATGVVQAVEAGATGLKTAEVIALARKIAAA